MRSRILFLFALCFCVEASSATRRVGPGIKSLRFNFLPVHSQKAFGVYIHDSNDTTIHGHEAPCHDIYQQYLRARDADVWDGNGSAADRIYDTSQCILDHLSAPETQNIASAAALLGLVPVLLSTLGPSMSELGLISLKKPLLAVLISVGTVVPRSTRALSFYDDQPKDVLNRPHGLGKDASKRSKGGERSPRNTFLYIAIGIAEYIIAGAMVFNTLYTSWQMGVSSVYILESSHVHYPLVWNLIPLGIHGSVAACIHHEDHASQMAEGHV